MFLIWNCSNFFVEPVTKIVTRGHRPITPSWSWWESHKLFSVLANSSSGISLFMSENVFKFFFLIRECFQLLVVCRMLSIYNCFLFFFNVQLGLSGHSEDCIGTKDIKELWEQIDTDGDGVIDLSDFSVCPSRFCYFLLCWVFSPLFFLFNLFVFLIQLISWCLTVHLISKRMREWDGKRQIYLLLMRLN